jgi:hypothetical protein
MRDCTRKTHAASEIRTLFTTISNCYYLLSIQVNFLLSPSGVQNDIVVVAIGSEDSYRYRSGIGDRGYGLRISLKLPVRLPKSSSII